MSKKIAYTIEVQKQMAALAKAYEAVQALRELYFDRGYNSGGADAIADADISSTGLTAANLSSAITAIEQYENFVENSAVTAGDYYATMNIARDTLPGGS